MTYVLLFGNIEREEEIITLSQRKTSGGLNDLELLNKALPYLEIKLVQTKVELESLYVCDWLAHLSSGSYWFIVFFKNSVEFYLGLSPCKYLLVHWSLLHLGPGSMALLKPLDQRRREQWVENVSIVDNMVLGEAFTMLLDKLKHGYSVAFYELIEI